MAEWTKERLVAFTNRVAEAFEAKQIKAPVHLCSDSQADHLIRIFQDVQPEDWVFATWRNSFHCLLKGVPEEELFQAILAGRSMTYCSKEHRIICSSIVGGHLPIAAGVAMGIKQRGGQERVFVFVGDMCKRIGLFHEAVWFSAKQRLPIRFVVEDNGMSTDTPTEESWGCHDPVGWWSNVLEYDYERSRPHVGTGNYVNFNF